MQLKNKKKERQILGCRPKPRGQNLWVRPAECDWISSRDVSYSHWTSRSSGVENSQVRLTYSMGGSRRALLGDRTGKVQEEPTEEMTVWLDTWTLEKREVPRSHSSNGFTEKLGSTQLSRWHPETLYPHEKPGYRDLSVRTEKASRSLASRTKTLWHLKPAIGQTKDLSDESRYPYLWKIKVQCFIKAKPLFGLNQSLL